MNAQSIIETAAVEGLVVDLSPTGNLKVGGDKGVIARWTPVLKQHKTEIVDLLSKKQVSLKSRMPPIPEWCNSSCEHFHRLDVPEVGLMQWCCHEEDEIHWRRVRIDKMTGCPERKKTEPTRKHVALVCSCRFNDCTMLGDRKPLECHWNVEGLQ
jgi:hypothetical protein